MSVSASTPPPPVPLKNVINTAIEKPSEILVHQSTHSLESNTSSSDSYSSMPSTPGSRSSSTLMTPSSSISDYYSQQQQQQQNQSQQQILDHSHIKPGKNASLLSYAQTITMYRKNAKRTNNPDIQCDFAKFLIEASQQQDSDSKNNKEYLVEAEKLLKQLSIKGHPESQYNLGKLYSMGVLNKKDKPDWDKAFNLYIQASKRNHADAANRAGECYEKGYGCRINGPKAVQFYVKAASLNHAGAMYRLGMAYMNGELGLASNPKDGVKWFSRSVEAVTPEYPEALHELAALHEQGIPNVVFIDLAYAAQLYEQAANLEYAPSAFRMGECYEYGKLNCQRDPALSIHYYTIAAENKHREACFALTAWYLVGSPNILQQSDENAYIWARRAAELELPKAEYAVGYFTETGIGCAKDPEQSLAWYNKAAEHGDKRAIQRLQGKVPQTQKNSPGRKSIQDDCKIM